MNITEEQFKLILDFYEESEIDKLEDYYDEKLISFLFETGFVLPFLQLKEDKTISEIKQVFKNSLKRRDFILEFIEVNFTKEHLLYQQYEQNVGFIKDSIDQEDEDLFMSLVNNKLFEKMFPMLLEYEVNLNSLDYVLLKASSETKKFLAYNNIEAFLDS